MCEKNFTTVDLYADTMTSFLLVIFSKIFAKWSKSKKIGTEFSKHLLANGA